MKGELDGVVCGRCYAKMDSDDKLAKYHVTVKGKTFRFFNRTICEKCYSEVMDFLQWETAWDIDNPRG